MPRLKTCPLATRMALAPILHGLPRLHVRGHFSSRQSGNFGGLGTAMRRDPESVQRLLHVSNPLSGKPTSRVLPAG
jgi:hypothetical protein